MKPLFIPLKGEFYDAFKDGTKEVEYRRYGPRWNEKTCPIGRPVVLSRGYGKRSRMQGVVTSFYRSRIVTRTESWRKCYGSARGWAACIRIAVQPSEQQNEG